jgi:hypothetical protein
VCLEIRGRSGEITRFFFVVGGKNSAAGVEVVIGS